jgi:hypothetical protein
VTNNGQAPQLLRNDGGNRNHWLSLRLAGTRSNRDGIGAKITVKAGGVTQVSEMKGGSSYQSAHDPRLHFGLGNAAKIDSLRVEWPSGTVETFTDIQADRFFRIEEGRRELADMRPRQSAASSR